jgi:putative DNA-invertase from lambdoid prophage Rac
MESCLSRTFGYARVSRRDLTTDNQRLEIESAGFTIDPRRYIEETISGSVAAFQRPGFSKLVDRLEEGDRIVVSRIDRLGRNAMDVRATVDELARRKISVHCLALGGADLTSSAGRMTMAVIAAVSEFERDLLVERTQAGLKRVVSEGGRLGRPPALTAAQKEEVILGRSAGRSLGQLAKAFGVSRAAIQRVEKAARAG